MVTLLRSLLLVTAVLGADIASAQGRTLNVLLVDDTVGGIENSTEADTTHLSTLDITADITDVTSTMTDKTFDSGALANYTVDFADLSGTTSGDFFTTYYSATGYWAIGLDKAGTGVEPTGALWVAADAAGRTLYVNVSAATNDENIGSAVMSAMQASTAFLALFNPVDNEDGTMTIEAAEYGATATWTRHNAGQSGNGSIALTQVTAGVDNEVDVDTDVVTVPSHGYVNGLKVQLTTTGTLPAGVTTTTDYYLIPVTSNTVAFATSQANALAGTKINLTDVGAGVGTFAVEDTLAGTIKLQKNNEPKDKTAIWFDVANSSQNVTATGKLNWTVTDAGFRSLRAVVAITEGAIDTTVRLNAK